MIVSRYCYCIGLFTVLCHGAGLAAADGSRLGGSLGTSAPIVASWPERLATELVGRLHTRRMNLLARTRGYVLADPGGPYVQVSLGADQGFGPGDLLEVSYFPHKNDDGSISFRPAHAATLLIVGNQGTGSMTWVIDRAVPEKLTDPRFRVSCFKGDRCPVAVGFEILGGPAYPQLISALKRKLETSPHFSLVMEDPCERSMSARAGTILVDRPGFVYVNLNAFDGLRVNDMLEADSVRVVRDADGRLQRWQGRVALYRVMRVDGSGSLCEVVEREEDPPTDIVFDRVTVRPVGHPTSATSRGESESPSPDVSPRTSANLPAGVPSLSGQAGKRMASTDQSRDFPLKALPEHAAGRICILQLRFTQSRSSVIEITASLTRLDEIGGPLETQVFLDSVSMRLIPPIHMASDKPTARRQARPARQAVSRYPHGPAFGPLGFTPMPPRRGQSSRHR